MKKIFVALLLASLLTAGMMFSANAAEYVYYENDFSDAATLADFTQYRGEWGIVDGQLMLVGIGELAMDDQAWMLFTKDEGIMNLTDYILEVDMMNIQTQAGPIFRSDLNLLNPEKTSGFCGYQAFTSFAAAQGVLGRGNIAGNWEGNFKAGDKNMAPGDDLHIKVTAEGKNITVVMSNLDTGEELWNYTQENDEWSMGTFGFRAVVMNNGMTNLGMLGFDNLKITAIGEVGDHLSAGKPLSAYKPTVVSAAALAEITPAIEVTVPEVVSVHVDDLDMTKTEYVFYENDFSDPATIADFTQYRGKWSIKDGALYFSDVAKGFESSGNFSFLLYSANHDANLLSHYVVEADMYNVQSTAGVLTHCDLSQACSDNSSAFYGYSSHTAQLGDQFVTGYGNMEGGWGGNISIGPKEIAPGSNYHVKVDHRDGLFCVEMSVIGSDAEPWTYIGASAEWPSGTFGFRSISAKDVLINLNAVSFDNLKVTVYGDEAVLLNAGYHPNAVIEGRVVETTAPETTVAPETDAPEETEVPAADAPATTAAPVAPAEEGGVNVGLIVGIALAVIVVAAIVVIILKKKKN